MPQRLLILLDNEEFFKFTFINMLIAVFLSTQTDQFKVGKEHCQMHLAAHDRVNSYVYVFIFKTILADDGHRD